MADEQAIDDTVEGLVRSLAVESDIQIRNLAKREIDMRIMPWNVVINSIGGTEEFARGAFADTDPSKVILVGAEHERQLALGHNGKPDIVPRPVGKGMSIEERDDGAYMTFKVARTQAGDDALALIDDGITRGVSVEFAEVPGGTIVSRRAGRRHVTHARVRLDGVTTTYRPAYGEQAAVLAVRSQYDERDTPVTEASAAAQEAPAPPQFDPAALEASMDGKFKALEAAMAGALQARSATPDDVTQAILSRLDAMEEKDRARFAIPSGEEPPYPADFHRGDWAHIVLRMMTGETVNHQEIQARITADLITTDNLGVIPTAYLSEIIGIIDESRPFMDSTTRLPLPRAGTTLSVPKIVTRPTTGIQAEEKDELASTATSIVPATFNMTSIGGYGDISVQLLKRSDPSYLSLYTDLLAEAYAIDADDKAIDVLLAESTVVEGGELDPEDLTLGAAWQAAAAVSRRLKLDRIWMSTAAVAAFIDAKSPLNNGPLYSTLAADITAGNGVGGTISGLRPVHVPALDDEAVDVIVGPSRGFGWTEDGTYTLQVDVPAKAGRDVGIIGMAWFAPLYPAAFTTYTIAS